jgi:hypothetical protein
MQIVAHLEILMLISYEIFVATSSFFKKLGMTPYHYSTHTLIFSYPSTTKRRFTVLGGHRRVTVVVGSVYLLPQNLLPTFFMSKRSS